MCKTNLQGIMDNSFGQNGIIYYDKISLMGIAPNYISGLKIGPNNDIFISINHADSCFILNYNANGTLNQNFGINGAVKTRFTEVIGTNTVFMSMVKDFDIQIDGKIILLEDNSLANNIINPNSNQVLIRLNTNGSIDTTFNNGKRINIDKQYGFNFIKYIAPTHLYLAGASTSTLTPPYDMIATVLKYNLSNVVGINETDKQTILQIYPNPFTNQLFVNNMHEVKTLHLFDVLGKQIKINVQGNTVFTEATLTSGLYFLKAQLKNGVTVTQKVVKE